jgi:hypothetical protein
MHALKLRECIGRAQFARDEAIGDPIGLLEQREFRGAGVDAEVDAPLGGGGPRGRVVDRDVDPRWKREDRDGHAEALGACRDKPLEPLRGRPRLVQHPRELREKAVADGLCAGRLRCGVA